MPNRALAIALVLSLVLAAAAEAREEWNQEAVTAIADQLTQATRALNDKLRRDPVMSSKAKFGERHAAKFWQSVDELEKTSRTLAHRLKQGASFAETAPIVTKMRGQVHAARTHGSRLTDTKFMEDQTSEVQALLARLAPYYYDDAPRTPTAG